MSDEVIGRAHVKDNDELERYYADLTRFTNMPTLPIVKMSAHSR